MFNIFISNFLISTHLFETHKMNFSKELIDTYRTFLLINLITKISAENIITKIS